ncbi:hypothetical protein TRFO_03714 [Tritrichomonas foetus]|uniref:Guanylate cyclase domain-containing protein n=1 Tax=Tritrichomonas foetus TaxID=1144522 RepID=A0A1J4KRK6_9EUKA|nr:hypothetical protein TRFO_03714 [Tritrichomonas foetus]|eukprot:OHT12093.1 hypothetical protein TRFO_03714 [Tritrichomonas foetus]
MLNFQKKYFIRNHKKKFNGEYEKVHYNNVRMRMIPHSPWKRLIWHLWDVSWQAQQMSTLPIPLYSLAILFRAVQSTFPLLMTGFAETTWADSEYIKNIVKFLQVFWRYGSSFTSVADVNICFVVIFILTVICFIPFIVGAIYLCFRNTYPITLAYFINLCHEVIFPVTHSWFVSQFATVVGLYLTKQEFHALNFQIQIIVLFLFCVIHIFFSNYIIFFDTFYTRGRTYLWDSNMHFHIDLFNDGILFFTRLTELMPTYYRSIFAVCVFVIAIGKIIYFVLQTPMIDLHLNVNIEAMSTAFLACFVLLITSNYNIHIHIIYVFLAFIFVIIISRFIYKALLNRKIQKYSTILDILSNDDTKLFEYIFTQKEFLDLARIGFSQGNLYIISWKPFTEVLSQWPYSQKIWMQYLKFILIYYEENMKLTSLLVNLKVFRNFKMRIFRKQIKIIKESQNRHTSLKTKGLLKNIDEKIKKVQTYVISYWNAIKNNSLNSSFDISKQLNKMINEVQSDFIYLISQYPNNGVIPLKYATFLNKVVCNPIEGLYWYRRGNLLSKTGSYMYDVPQISGFEVFSQIPHSLRIISTTARFDENEISTTRSINSTDDSKPLEIVMEQTTQDIKNEEFNTTGSHIYNLGKEANVSFISLLITISVIFFVLAFLFCAFAPTGLLESLHTNINNYVVALMRVARIIDSYSVSSYFLFQKALMVEKVLPSNHEILKLIQATNFESLYDEPIITNIQILNNVINDLQKLYGHEIDIHSQMGQEITNIQFLLEINHYFDTSYISANDLNLNNSNSDNLSINFTAVDDENHYYLSFFQAVNILCSYFYKYTKERTDKSFLNQDWERIIQINSKEIPMKFMNILVLAAYDVSNCIDANVDLISHIYSIAFIIEVTLLLILIYFASKIRNHWNYIIRTINTLPRVAIQKVIERNSLDEKIGRKFYNQKHERSEFRYQGTYIQLVASRDTSTGVPSKQIIVISICNLIASVVSSLLVYMNIKNMNPVLKSLPTRYFMVYCSSAAFYSLSNLLLREMVLDSNMSIYDDNYRIHTNELLEVSKSFKQLLNNALFGQFKGGTLTGYAFAGSPQMNNLLYGHYFPDFSNESGKFNKLRKLPKFVSLEILVNYWETISEDIIYNNRNISMYDKDVWTYLKYTTDCLSRDILYEIFRITMETIVIEIEKTYAMIPLVGALVAIIGGITIGWLLYQLITVFKTVRFVLSSLSMIDFDYIQNNSKIFELFNGNSSGQINNMSTLINSMTKIVDLIPEPVVEIDDNLLIIDSNAKFSDWLEIPHSKLIGNTISNYIQFSKNNTFENTNFSQKKRKQDNNSKINDFNTLLKDVIKLTENEEVVEKEAEFELISNGILERKSFYLIHLKTAFESTLIIIFKTSQVLSLIEKEILKLQEEINELVLGAIPKRLIKIHDNFSVENRRFTTHFVVISTIEIINFTEYSKVHSPTESSMFYSKFSEFIEELCQTCDGIKTMHVGTLIYVSFNLIKQIPNYYSSAKDSLAFLRKVNEFSHKNGYKVRFATIISKRALAKIDGTAFLLCTNKIKILRKIVRLADNSCVTMTPSFMDLMPRDIVKDAIQIRTPDFNYNSKHNINGYNKVSWVFSLCLNESNH